MAQASLPNGEPNGILRRFLLDDIQVACKLGDIEFPDLEFNRLVDGVACDAFSFGACLTLRSPGEPT